MESGIIVIDVPEGVSADQAARLLSAPGNLYFMVQILPTGAGHRAYFRRYKQDAPVKKDTPDETVALSVVRANRDKPVRAIVSLVGAAGVKRSRQWVCDRLAEVLTEDGREDDAVRFLKERPTWDPAEIVTDLAIYKIKRTAPWVRQKRKELADAVIVPNS
jgi:hypothetical protein